MAINIAKQPDEISISRNRMPLKVTVSPLVSVNGVKSVWSLLYNSDPADGDTIEIEIGTQSILFTFRTSPNVNVATDLPLRGTMTINDYIVQLANDFAHQYDISQAYAVTYINLLGTHAVVFTANITGSAFDPTVTISSSAFSFNQSTAGVTEVLEPNNFVLLNIYVENTAAPGTFTSIGEVEHPVITSIVEFDLSTYLDAHVEPVAPPYRATSPILANNCRRKYFFEVAQISGNPIAATPPIYRSDYKWVLNGGIDVDRFGDMFDDVCAQMFWSNRQFLTNRSTNRRVVGSSDEFLYFFCFTKKFDSIVTNRYSAPGNQGILKLRGRWGAYDPFISDGGGTVDVAYTISGIDYTLSGATINAVTANDFEIIFPDNIPLFNAQVGDIISIQIVPQGDLILKTNIWFTDNTSISDHTLFTQSWTAKDVIIFPAGAINSGVVAVDPIRQVSAYEIYLVYQDSIVASAVKYTLDLEDYKDVWILYENSLSGYDTIRCYNTMVPIQKIDKLQFATPTPLLIDKTSAEIKTRRNGRTISYKINSGILTKEEYDALFEAFDSEDLLLSRDGKYIRCYIPGTSIEAKDLDDTHFFVDFELFEAKKHFGR